MSFTSIPSRSCNRVPSKLTRSIKFCLEKMPRVITIWNYRLLLIISWLIEKLTSCTFQIYEFALLEKKGFMKKKTISHFTDARDYLSYSITCTYNITCIIRTLTYPKTSIIRNENMERALAALRRKNQSKTL